MSPARERCGRADDRSEHRAEDRSVHRVAEHLAAARLRRGRKEPRERT
jgi:hypothetical protein